eukprot:3684402-Pleurochrysis_carterae.AAC.2
MNIIKEPILQVFALKSLELPIKPSAALQSFLATQNGRSKVLKNSDQKTLEPDISGSFSDFLDSIHSSFTLTFMRRDRDPSLPFRAAVAVAVDRALLHTG